MQPDINQLIKTELLYISHLNPDSSFDKSAIDSFSVNRQAGEGLLNYLRSFACNDELSHEMRTYLVRDVGTDECVGYFSVKAGLISINESKNNVNGEEKQEREFDTLPGLELANFAVNSAYIKNHPKLKGVGKYIFGRFIVPLAKTISEYVGVKMIYIFALPYESLISRYRSYGFSTLSEEAENNLHARLRPRYDRHCKFMYMLINT